MAKVLIVDDDDGIVQMLSDLMDDENMETVGITVADDVERVMETSAPDVVLLDLMLRGDRCGMEVAEDLTNGDLPETPMIAMTGSLFQAEVATESGLFVEVFKKPFDLDDLVLAISEAVAMSHIVPPLVIEARPTRRGARDEAGKP